MPVETQIALRVSEHPHQDPRPGDVPSEATVPVADATLRIRLFAPPEQTTVASVMPAARALADEQTRLLLNRLKAKGKRVPCKRGCSACCRYLVPLSIPEAMRLADDLSAMPKQRQNPFRRAFAGAGRCVNAAGPPPAGRGLEAIATWYANLQLDCPLLQDDLCSIYPARPIVCREFLVTSDPEQCAQHDPHSGEPAFPTISIAEVMAMLAAEIEGGPVESVLLPLAPAWAARNPHRLRQSLPAPLLAGRLTAVLRALATRAASDSSAA